MRCPVPCDACGEMVEQSEVKWIAGRGLCCECADEACDHEWEVIDESFDHEYGCEQIVYEMCVECGLQREYQRPQFDDDVI